ncbi:hypothetical protein CGCA056_v004062 [Colletotrichum aenigma]|nr:hypothetical protein CGCA056_v004062 [Colletotrichum aenigma]
MARRAKRTSTKS